MERTVVLPQRKGLERIPFQAFRIGPQPRPLTADLPALAGAPPA
jgi:hypothetical protein